MVFDALILILVGGAVVVGFRRGMVQPLLVEIGFLGVLWLFISHWSAYSGWLEHALHVNPIASGVSIPVFALAAAYGGARLGGLIHRMPVVQGADGLLGVFVHGLIALFFCYFMLSSVVSMDKAFGPVLDGAAMTQAQAQQARTALLSQPLVSQVVDHRDLDLLVHRAKQPGGVRVSDLSSLQQLETLYGNLLEPQLRGSRLTPVVLAIGQHAPGLGHYGPSDLRPQPAPAPSPSPSKRPASQP